MDTETDGAFWHQAGILHAAGTFENLCLTNSGGVL